MRKVVCVVCGREFETKHVRKVTCSPECHAKHRRAYQCMSHYDAYHDPDGRYKAQVLAYAARRRDAINATRQLRYAKLREAARRAEEMRAALRKAELLLERLAWREGLPAAAREDVAELREMVAGALRPPAPAAKTPEAPSAPTIREILGVPEAAP